MTEADLRRKLAAIEALISGSTTVGERIAAEAAQKRLEERLQGPVTPTCEDHHFTIHDVWARKLFMALAAKMDMHAFRYRGQRRTTLVVHGPKTKVMDLLWTQFLEAEQTLRTYLDEVTSRVIHEVLGGSDSDATERPVPQQLPGAGL